MHKKRRTAKVPLLKMQGEAVTRQRDMLVVEEPLTVMWQALEGPSQRLAATMRTPGEDNELAAGMLFSEGLLRHRAEVDVLSFCVSGAPNELNRLKARLRISEAEAERRLAHRPSASTPQSACGMCGFEELSSPKTLLKWASAARPADSPGVAPSVGLLHQALDHLRSNAPVFQATGASHAVVLVDEDGALVAAAEDVGRHNACDKAIGRLLLNARSSDHTFVLPTGTGILFSSRLSFELAAKAARAGASWVASIGAPTHLAIELTRTCLIPTIGFLSKERHNAYFIT